MDAAEVLTEAITGGLLNCANTGTSTGCNLALRINMIVSSLLVEKYGGVAVGAWSKQERKLKSKIPVEGTILSTATMQLVTVFCLRWIPPCRLPCGQSAKSPMIAKRLARTSSKAAARRPNYRADTATSGCGPLRA